MDLDSTVDVDSVSHGLGVGAELGPEQGLLVDYSHFLRTHGGRTTYGGDI